MIRRLLLLLILLPLPLAAQSGSTGGTVRSTGTIAANDCVKFVSKNVITSSGGACGSGSGTVSSVGLTINATSPSGIFTVSGSPVTTSGTLDVAIAGTSGGLPYFSSTTVLSSSALLTLNSPVLGGGAGATPKTATFLTTNGTAELDIGVAAGGNGVLGLKGTTSGTCTFTAPATAGSTTPVTAGCALLLPGGSNTLPALTFTDTANGFYREAANVLTYTAGADVFAMYSGGIRLIAANALQWSNNTSAVSGPDTSLCRQAAGVLEVANSTTCNSAGGFKAGTYLTDTNCANGASPAVCGSAAAGAVALPTGTNPTLVVNTTAVTANSRIILTVDESLTIAATTCNTTLSTLLNPVVTARTAGTSFTFTIGAIIASNPACVSYTIVN